MLRPASDALIRKKAETATTVVVLAFALLIPCLVVLAATFAGSAASDYLAAYRPVVYLETDADQAAAESLAEKITDWPQVDEAVLRTPDEALDALEERLGADEVAKLGANAEMLPFSVVIEPATPVLGHLDLVARASGLDARPQVASVDVPSSAAARTLSFARWILILGGVLLCVLVVTAMSQLRGHLLRLAGDQERESTLLAVFGAPPAKLRRPTLVRGVIVGVVSGVTAFAGLFVLLLQWQSARPEVLGLAATTDGTAWLVVISPLVLGPLVGFVSGWFANRSLKKRGKW